MVTELEKLEATIWLYRYNMERAKEAWDIYPEIADAFIVFEYHHSVAMKLKVEFLEILG